MLKLCMLAILLSSVIACTTGAKNKAELEKYKTAYSMMKDYRDFWFDQFEECVQEDYEESIVEEDYQIELILGDKK